MGDNVEPVEVVDKKDTGLEDAWKEVNDIATDHARILGNYHAELLQRGIPATLADQLVVNFSNYLLQLSFSD